MLEDLKIPVPGGGDMWFCGQGHDLAAAGVCVDESGHLALVNAGTRILLSKEVGEEERGTVDRRSGDDATAVDVLRP